MFTKVLDRFEQKDLLSLLYEITKCDDDSSSLEKDYIDSIKEETGIPYIPVNKNGASFVKSFEGKDIQKRKAVFYEAYCCMMADGILNSDELHIMRELQLALDLSMDEYDAIIAAADKLYMANKELNELIYGE